MNIADEFNTDPELISIREPFTKVYLSYYFKELL